MSIYTRALFITAIVGVIFFGAFFLWSKRLQPTEAANQITKMKSMETDGAPIIQAKDLKGAEFSLDQFKGKVILVNFWASWCGPCVEEFPSMIGLVEKMQGRVVLIAMSSDSDSAEASEFMKQIKGWERPEVRVAWDPQRTWGNEYGVTRLPETFILGPDMKLKRKIIGSIDWATDDAVAYMNKLAQPETH